MPVTYADLVRQRALLKRKITLALGKEGGANVSSDSLKQTLDDLLNKVSVIDESINAELLAGTSDDISAQLDSELENQTTYHLEIKTKINHLNAKPQPKFNEVSHDLKLPHLTCDNFSGEGTNNLEYHKFIVQFNNIIGSRTSLSNSVKFTYLKGYLRGYALKLINHLQITDENYKIALELLEAEFLNKEALIAELYQKLLEGKPKFDVTFLQTKLFINEVRCLLADLKVYNKDLLAENASKHFISHIIFNKLPMPVRQEMVRKVGNNYPSIDDIFTNYVDVIKTLTLRSPAKDSSTPNKPSIAPKNRSDPVDDSTLRAPKPVLLNASATVRGTCKFCSSKDHSMFRCPNYTSNAARVRRCKELRMCSMCSSSKHSSGACAARLDYPCGVCSSDKHISALCSKYAPEKTLGNVCLNNASGCGGYILPTLTIKVCRGKAVANVRCLIDTGSQRSYLKESVLTKLGYSEGAEEKPYNVSSFLNSGVRQMSEANLSVNFCDQLENFQLNFLIDKKFSLEVSVNGLDDAINTLRGEFPLADSAFLAAGSQETCKLDGLLGVDAIQFFTNFSLISCRRGAAFQYTGGIIPFGQVENFLSKQQIKSLTESKIRESAFLDSQVNFLIEKPTPHNYLTDFESGDDIEERLDNLFKVESLGLTEEKSDFDTEQIAKFRESVELIDGHYNVEIPWDADKLRTVDSGFNTALAVLPKITEKLKNNKLYDSYDAVFRQQIQDDILEEINLQEINTADHTWIPHRPVVRQGDQVTTKVRPVLNCSFKTRSSHSLNECAYPGVNLLQTIFFLLINLRFNTYLMLSDIKQAFLQIKLKSIFDRNRFSVLWYDEDGKLAAYRYKALVFGFVSSPFILNYIIKLHVAKYPLDLCSKFLANHFYVDNLLITGNDPNVLCDLYRESCRRMKEGGFELRSWSSNCPSTNALFSSDGSGAVHDSDHEKLLGYRYYAQTDEIKLAEVTPPLGKPCKRLVLSFLGKLFDPLGLFFPVIAGCKILLRDLWLSKVGWDDALSKEMLSRWQKLTANVLQLNSFSFQRKVAKDQDPVSLVIFTDASKVMYGFCAYLKPTCSSSKPNLVFAKGKSAPLKAKTIPTLELLAVFLALKCISNLLKSLNPLNLGELFICVDSQVVLSWILSGKVNSKNLFARNRVRDVRQLILDVEETFNLGVKFRYVCSSDNPADMVSRGVTAAEWLRRLEFWKHGPHFLNENPIAWPVGHTGCFSDRTINLTSNSAVVETKESLFDVNRFSSLKTLISVTAFIYLFIAKARKLSTKFLDCVAKAKLYWIKREQSVHFSRVIEYLNCPSKQVPNLVRNLNLFLDRDGILRAKGRLDKCYSLSYDKRNPILLPKESHLTELFVWDAHFRCCHLGVKSTLNLIRSSGLWIPHGRAVVKKTLNKCVVCKKINSLPFKQPKFTDFHKDRANFVLPFRNTGVDFTGALNVQYGDKVKKFYMLIFTCLNIRAVHLELLPDMSTDSFLLAFKRFCNSQIVPSVLYSDNASTFLKAGSILSNLSLDCALSAFLIQHSIRHKTIPLYSPWVGSLWERMIRVVKNCLFKSIGRKKLEYFQLITLLSDVQNVVNSRPLTYLEDTDGPSFNVLTPNSFLKPPQGISAVVMPESEKPIVATREVAVESWQTRVEVFEHFKEMWYDEYLLSLRELGRDLFSHEWKNKINCNDIVLISSPVETRPFWQLGRVVEVIVGADSCVRAAKVLRPDGSEGIYSIKLLCPLELSCTGHEGDRETAEGKAEAEPEAERVQPPCERPQRKAALQCKARLAKC